MNAQERTDLLDILSKPGWEVYKAFLQKEFDRTYKRLRRAQTGKEISDKNLLFINGILDGLEKSMRLAETKISEYDDEVADQNADDLSPQDTDATTFGE